MYTFKRNKELTLLIALSFVFAIISSIITTLAEPDYLRDIYIILAIYIIIIWVFIVYSRVNVEITDDQLVINSKNLMLPEINRIYLSNSKKEIWIYSESNRTLSIKLFDIENNYDEYITFLNESS